MRILARLPLAVLLLAGFTAAAMADPAQNYMLYCMGCHGAQAEGVPGKVPALAHSLGNFMRLPAGRDYLLRVPGAANTVLNDADLTAVLNWLAAEYSAEEIKTGVAPFSVEEVTAHRHEPLIAVLARRREVIRALQANGIGIAENY